MEKYGPRLLSKLPESPYEHGSSSRLEQACHILDGQGVDAVLH